MGLGNFLHGIIAQINPFDNGQTYSTFNPQKKKQDDGTTAPVAAPSAPVQPSQSNTQLQAQQHQNLFQSLNQNMKLPSANQPGANLAGNVNLKPLTNPQPGTVVQPTQPQKINQVSVPKGMQQAAGVTGTRTTQNGQTGIMATNKVTGKTNFVPDAPIMPKKQGFWGKVGSGLKTAGETAAGTVANAPEVVMAAGRAATGIVQGVTQIPHLVTAAAATGTQQLAKTNLPGTHAINTGVQAANTGVKTATNVVDTPLNWAGQKIDQGAQAYANHVPFASGGDTAYKATQIPLNILAALVTGGGSAAGDVGEGAEAGSKIGQAADFLKSLLNKPLTSNPDNVIARTGQAVTNKTAPVVQTLNTPISSARSGITRLINGRTVPTGVAEATDAGEAANAAADAGNATQIPVSQPTPIEVQGAPGEPQTVPVTNNTPTGQPIVEVGGDKPGQVRVPTPDEVAAQRATDRFNSQAPGKPDAGIEGVSPADTGNASALFTRAQIDQEQTALDQALKDGDIDAATHKIASKELQSNAAIDDKPTGTKIQVKQASSIPVTDQTVPASDATSAPGTVKVTAASDPNAAASEAAANAPKVATPASLPNAAEAASETPKQLTKRTIAAARNQRKLARQYAKVQEDIAAATGNNSGVADTVLHLPDQGVHAKLTPEQANILADENKNIPWTTNDRPHLTAGQAVLDRTKEVSQDEIAKMSPNAAKALENAGGIKTVPTTDPGFVPTNQFRRGARGNISEVAHRDMEAAQGAHDIANTSVEDVLKQSQDELTQNGHRSPATVRNLKAIMDSGTLSRTSPEFKAVAQEYRDAISNHARALSMTDRTVRTTATGDQLTNRFTSKLLGLADDSSKIGDSDIQQVSEAENAFTDARDAANQAAEQFKSTGDDQDFKAWKAAQAQADTADRHAKLTEYLVSKRVLKGNKNVEATQAVHDAERNAGVYSMDAIDSNMLSGTGTMVRNYVNTLFPRVENKLFGRVSSVVAKKLTGVDALGGSSGRGARIGAKIGSDTYKADLAARQEAGIGRIRRAVTAGNTIGEKNIEATTYSKAFSHYKQMLADEGYKGKELNNRAEFNVRTDPDGLVDNYRRDTLQANALSGLTHDRKIENVLSDGIQKALQNAGFGHTGQMVGRTAAKAVARVGLGFPTVVARSLVEGVKRATLGIPEAGWSTMKFLKTGNKEAYASELTKAMQHAGSGGSLMLLGNALGKAGVISGSYPTDKATQAQWEAEGKQENSIKIGGQWFSIPGYLGGFALPLQLGATMANGNIKDEATAKNAWSTILSSSPVDNIQSTLQIISGTGTDAKIKNAVTSLARSATPAGAFVAELAKMTDKTQNDTTTKGAVQNIIDSIAGGIPGLNNAVNTIPKTDAYGNVLRNPNPVAVALGAQGVEQGQGTKDVNAEQSASDQTMQQLQQYGVVGDKNLMQLVDPKLAKEIQSGQKLAPADVVKVQKAVTKGVSASEDNNWRQEGNYTTDKAALQTKLQMLNADPTSKPSEKQQYQTQINRDDVLAKNKIPYEDLKTYESTTLSEWREMGNPKSDTYDPDTYNALWKIDQQMAKGGASYNTKNATQQKFSAKAVSSGSGSGSGSNGFSSDFGKIDMGSLAPSVQSYDSITKQSGSVPIINTVRPNIVHNISSSG